MEPREAAGGPLQPPGEPRSSEPTSDLLELIISGEEEPRAVPENSLTNGHGEAESEATVPVRSPGTSYWSITEGPDQPLLLSLAPGPSRRKPRVQRASRPGLSRIPGRDHRRYYHEYWRSEYLMDFDPQRHGMICMVCGSSLATLKLSTIKRHIRQKHPDSLLWGPHDKDLIRSGWESHLSLAGGQRSLGPAATPTEQGEDSLMHQHTTGDLPDPETPQQPLSLSPEAPPPREEEEEEEEEEQEAPGPSAVTLERYLNDSLHAWFRQEFLMEYEAEAGRLLCMVCGAELPSLHLDHIKSHVLERHPHSLVYSSEEKHCVLQAWAHAHEESENSLGSEPITKDEGAELYGPELDALHSSADSYVGRGGAPGGHVTLTQDTCLIGEDGGVGAPQQGPPTPRQPRRRRLRGGEPWRLRLDYLVAYGPRGQGTFCMVCSQLLTDSKVSSFRRHIQDKHPETTALSRQDRHAMAAAWTKDSSHQGVASTDELRPSDDAVLNMTGESTEDTSPDVPAVKEEEGVEGVWRDGGGAAPSRHGHYPGKDQRRNYQARWRLDYLMDYDGGRHGLICMVCGAALATLKVSTIKRHIQQVHPHTLDYSAPQRQQAILTYSNTHSQLHTHTAGTQSPACDT